ncbi:MAG TPA: glycosyl hydrolase, partial [Acidobacteriota bacterium]|nr:glycosyl hydrolase [Acidobacteriota bacterium]
MTVDNSKPFYYVYGGTQDNFTLGGPSRTTTSHGIRNSDWFITIGGDGFQSQVDPEDPNIVYSQSQYGGIMRFDRKNGEKIDIQPQPGKGEPPLHWNWDSPLIISPHSHTRLYFAANKVFLSNDRGDNWTAVSPDLTRQIDRNKLEVMGRVWSVDSVAKNSSTSFYGNIVAMAESPLQAGLLYVGTDDGLIQVTADGGKTWKKSDRFPGVPDRAYVSRVMPSSHNVDTVYAAFNNHKMGDFKPYLLKSNDGGKSWTSIAGNLPQRGSVWAIVEDPQNSNLLFVGTEFGVFFSMNSGKRWTQLKGGIPVIAVRDLAIQKRENDLVVATFGRGFYILDDITPLRLLTETSLDQELLSYPAKESWMYIPEEPLGLPEKSFQGHSFFTAPNPPAGAVFTYYLKEEIKTRKKARQEKEKELIKEEKDVFYPSWEDLREEDREEEPAIAITVTDEEGNVVRRITGPATAGFHRVSWDLRYPPATPVQLETKSDEDDPFTPKPIGPLA